MAVAAAAVSVSKGVMDSVLAKLGDLAFDMGASIIGMPNDIRFLREELPAMNALLENLKDTDELDLQVKCWRYEVREMTYDIEDCIDDFKSNVATVDSKASLLGKVSNFVMTLRVYYDTAKQIKELKTRLQEIDERRKRYKLDDYCNSSTSIEALDSRLSALYNEAGNLVGIDNQREELMEWLLDEDKKLKVVSIVGQGGLGKTALVNEVYHQVREQFNCKAFVSVSRTPDMTRILTSMIYSVENISQQDEKSHVYDVQYLINRLRKYLLDKRYLVIVDDLWDELPWNTIRCAFPPNNEQSRVIVTTRHVHVARTCCSDHRYIHCMEPLSDTNSKILLLKRISISEDDHRFENSETVLCGILKKCGGLPLAIITIAGILACQQLGTLKQQWECIRNSLALQSAANPNLEDMVHILDLSYKSLPHHLKSCFLYLGKYPEDHKINRDELVRQWVAEGFVMSSSGRDVWDIAEGYFNGLINRSMIQPVYQLDNTVVHSCRVHDMMLDLILNRCQEDNFMTMVRASQEVKARYKVRRLSLDMSMSGTKDVTMTVATTSLLSKVRSLAIFGGPDWIPHLLEFKFIRVMFLEFHKLVGRIDLTCFIQLSQLRYLKIKHMLGETNRRLHWPEANIELPSQIKRLQHLETLELLFSFSQDFCLPSDIVDLRNLSHLIVPYETILPDGIGKLNQLRTLEGFSLSKSSSENIKALGTLTKLVDLSLYSSEEAGTFESVEAKICALRSALEKLSYLKTIFNPGFTDWCGDGLS